MQKTAPCAVMFLATSILLAGDTLLQRIFELELKNVVVLVSMYMKTGACLRPMVLNFEHLLGSHR